MLDYHKGMSSLMQKIAQAIPTCNGWQPSEATDATVVVPTEKAHYTFKEIAPNVVRFTAHSTALIPDVETHAIMVNFLDETASVLMAGRMTRLALSVFGEHTLISSLATIPFPTDVDPDTTKHIISRLIVESEIMLTYVISRFRNLPTVELPYATSNMGTFLPANILNVMVERGDPLGALAQFIAMHSANAPTGKEIIRRTAGILSESEFDAGEVADVDGVWGVAATLRDEPVLFQFVADSGLLTVVAYRRLPAALTHHQGLRLIDAGNAHADVFTALVTGRANDESDELISQLIVQTSADVPTAMSDDELRELVSALVNVIDNAERRLLDYAKVLEAE